MLICFETNTFGATWLWTVSHSYRLTVQTIRAVRRATFTLKDTPVIGQQWTASDLGLESNPSKEIHISIQICFKLMDLNQDNRQQQMYY